MLILKLIFSAQTPSLDNSYENIKNEHVEIYSDIPCGFASLDKFKLLDTVLKQDIALIYHLITVSEHIYLFNNYLFKYKSGIDLSDRLLIEGIEYLEKTIKKSKVMSFLDNGVIRTKIIDVEFISNSILFFIKNNKPLIIEKYKKTEFEEIILFYELLFLQGLEYGEIIKEDESFKIKINNLLVYKDPFYKKIESYLFFSHCKIPILEELNNFCSKERLEEFKEKICSTTILDNSFANYCRFRSIFNVFDRLRRICKHHYESYMILSQNILQLNIKLQSLDRNIGEIIYETDLNEIRSLEKVFSNLICNKKIFTYAFENFNLGSYIFNFDSLGVDVYKHIYFQNISTFNFRLNHSIILKIMENIISNLNEEMVQKFKKHDLDANFQCILYANIIVDLNERIENFYDILGNINAFEIETKELLKSLNYKMIKSPKKGFKRY